MQFKFALSYITIIAILLIILNFYPVILSRDLVFKEKQASMQNQVLIMSTSLSALDDLNVESTAQVMALLDVMNFSRVIVINREYKTLYDTSNGGANIGKSANNKELTGALAGKDCFRSVFSDNAFRSYASAPIIINNNIVGAVYVYEYDGEQAALIMGIRNNLLSISAVISVFSLLVAMMFSRIMSRRITSVLDAMKNVREGAYGYTLDVKGHDELSELGDEFNTLSERLQDTDKMRRQFVSDASHELKTPLASIRLLSDSIIQSPDMDRDTMLEFVDDIGREAERLNRITEKLLKLSRLDADKDININGTAVEVGTVIEKALGMLQPLAYNISVNLEYSKTGEHYVYATEDDIYQVIFNLAENAIKYNVQDGTVFISVCSVDKKVIIKIEDTGIGIPVGDLEHIFERFYRVDKARSRAGGGSGLGLSIVRDTVAIHNGSVSAAARDGGGSVFTVVFPEYTPKDSK